MTSINPGGEQLRLPTSDSKSTVVTAAVHNSLSPPVNICSVSWVHCAESFEHCRSAPQSGVLSFLNSSDVVNVCASSIVLEISPYIGEFYVA